MGLAPHRPPLILILTQRRLDPCDAGRLAALNAANADDAEFFDHPARLLARDAGPQAGW